LQFFSVGMKSNDKGVKLEFFMVCKGEGISVRVQGKISYHIIP